MGVSFDSLLVVMCALARSAFQNFYAMKQGGFNNAQSFLCAAWAAGKVNDDGVAPNAGYGTRQDGPGV